MFAPNSLILYVADVSVSAKFYEDILGVGPSETFPDFAVFVLNESFVLGLQGKDAIDPKPQPAFGGFELCHSDVTPDEVDAIHEKWKSFNVTIIQEPTHLDFGYTFVALDPDGHRLRVCATDTSKFE